MDKYRGNVNNEHDMMNHYESWWYETHGDPHADTKEDMSLAKQIKQVADEQRALKEKAETKVREERERFREKAQSEWINSTINRIQNNIADAALKGEEGVTGVLWASTTEGFYEIEKHFEALGFKTSRNQMDPFGSDPMFFNTVYSLYISW